MVEAELLKNRPSRGGRMIPVEANDFAAKSALFLALSEHAKKHDNAAWRDKEMTFEKALGILDSEEAMYKHSIKEQQATLKATRGKKEKDEIKAVIAANEAELALTLDTKNMGTKLSG